MRTETIELVTQYKEGREIKEFSCNIFGARKSVTRTEFYSAYGVGLMPRYIFEINPSEYKLADIASEGRIYHATHIRYDGELYEIARTYQKNRFKLEVTVK